MVLPLEQVRKEGSRVSFHCGSIVPYCVVDIQPSRPQSAFGGLEAAGGSRGHSQGPLGIDAEVKRNRKAKKIPPLLASGGSPRP